MIKYYMVKVKYIGDEIFFVMDYGSDDKYISHFINSSNRIQTMKFYKSDCKIIKPISKEEYYFKLNNN